MAYQIKGANIVSYRDFNFRRLHIEHPTFQPKSECFVSSLKYNLSKNAKPERFFLQTPRMKIVDIVQSDKQVVIICEFPTKHPKFYDVIYGLDETVIETLLKKSKKWFAQKNKLDKVDLEELYSSSILPPESLVSKPRIRFKIPIYDGSIQCLTFDKHEKKIPFGNVRIGGQVVALLGLESLYYYKEKWYLDWTVFQLKWCPKVKVETKYLFDDDSDDEYNVKDIDSDYEN